MKNFFIKNIKKKLGCFIKIRKEKFLCAREKFPSKKLKNIFVIKKERIYGNSLRKISYNVMQIFNNFDVKKYILWQKNIKTWKNGVIKNVRLE